MLVPVVLSLLLSLHPADSLVGSYCNEDGSTRVAAQGDFQYNSIVFASKFKPRCSCTNNTLQCQNECETCFRGVCGVLETSQNERPETSVVSNYSLCMTYTNGRAPVGGKTCFKYDQAAKNTTYPDGSKICDMTYNGESCTWCKLYETGCIRANCTNILKDARVNTCWTAYQGVEKQFRLASLVNNITTIQETQLGRCGYSDLASIQNQFDEQFEDDDDSLLVDDDSLQITPEEDAFDGTYQETNDDKTDAISDPHLKSSHEQHYLPTWLVTAVLLLGVRLLDQ
jgi:hypothetical protein